MDEQKYTLTKISEPSKNHWVKGTLDPRNPIEVERYIWLWTTEASDDNPWGCPNKIPGWFASSQIYRITNHPNGSKTIHTLNSRYKLTPL